jgi:hypothetical protein
VKEMDVRSTWQLSTHEDAVPQRLADGTAGEGSVGLTLPLIGRMHYEGVVGLEACEMGQKIEISWMKKAGGQKLVISNPH